jgi:pyridoxal phosphate enzyme (YggS family)
VSEIARRLDTIRARIDAACRRSGRDPASVRLVGASKLQPVEALAEAHAAGLARFGENRVQEAAAKAPALPAGIEWHLFGPLQTNKVRPALRLFSLFHAIDREKVARALDDEARAQGVTARGLIEVNLGGEESKHGFAMDGIAEAIAPLAELRALEIVGLMSIPPPSAEAEGARVYFRRLRALRDDLDRRAEWRGRLAELSMGMSDDFEVAIEEGATYVRVGTLLFGVRPAA